MIYYKQCSGTHLPQKAAELQNWVQWTHHAEGKTHCEKCLKLDGCWFQKEKAPPCPHHPYCHCTLEPIDHTVVLANATTYTATTVSLIHTCLTLLAHIHTEKKSCSNYGGMRLRIFLGSKLRQSDNHWRNIYLAIIHWESLIKTVKESIYESPFNEEVPVSL